MAGSDSRAPADSGRAADREAEAGGFLSRWSRRKVLVRQGGAPAEPVPAAVATAAEASTVKLGSDLATPPGSDRAGTPGDARADQPGVDPPSAARPAAGPPAASPPAAPTLADVDLLNRDSDYAPFVQPGVDAAVRNAALKKLFSDPHFNLMDRLDTYIDDYSLPDPLPTGMLRQMVQSHALGLFDEAPDETAEPVASQVPAPANPLSTGATLGSDPELDPDPAPEPLPEPIQAPDEDPDLRLQPHSALGPAGPGTGAVPDARRER